MQEYFKDPRTIERLHRGPLSNHLKSYAALLSQCSYSQASAQSQLLLVSRFSQWLQRNGIELRKVDEDVLQRFLRLSPRKRRIQGGEVAALNRLLTLLRQRRVVPAKSHSARLRPRQKVTAEFGRYLLEERRLSQATWGNYLPFVERFLRERFENARVNFSVLRAADITGFVQRQARTSARNEPSCWSQRCALSSAIYYIEARSPGIWRHACPVCPTGRFLHCLSFSLQALCNVC